MKQPINGQCATSYYEAAARDSESGFMQRACPSVRLSVAKIQKTRFFSKTKQFRTMVSIDDL